MRRVLGTAEVDHDLSELNHLVWRPSQEQIELAVAGEFDVDNSVLFAKRLKKNDARLAAVYLIRRLTSMLATELAQRYGGVSQAAISKTVKRAEARRGEQRRWDQRLSRLEKSLRTADESIPVSLGAIIGWSKL